MKLYSTLCLAILVLTAALFVVPGEVAVGCAVAPHFGETVQIADESAIIIWDASSKTQHFIRRAAFTTAARDFGFLVPTPTKPELAEAGDEAFTALQNLTAPRIITQSAPSGGAGGGCGCGMSASKMAAGVADMAPQVEVLETKRVAGYDATVLQADDAGALTTWLKDHGYASSPELTGWAEPYVKAKWKFTAFKVARDDGPAKAGPATGKADPTQRDAVAASLSATAVRMTFHTEHPFFPYREPAANPPAKAPEPPVRREDGKVLPPLGYTGTAPPSRLLRVYFLAEGRVKGTLGEGGKDWSSTANSRVVWAYRLVDANRESILGQLKLPQETPPASWWLTEFEDHSSPRPGTDDVYFSVDDNQATVERPPIIQYVSANMPGCVMCYALALYLFLPRLLRLRRR